MRIAEFFAEIGLKGDKVANMSLRDLIGSFGDLKAITVAELGALYQLGTEFAEMAKEAYSAAAALHNFEMRTGLSAQELQKWQIVAEQANVSAGSVTQAVDALSRASAAIRLGQGNIAPFQILGISPHQSAFKILEQLRSSLRGMDRPMAVNLLGQLGIDASMINILSLTNKEFAVMAAQQEGIGAKTERAFLQGQLAITRFTQVVRYSGYSLVEIFGPTFNALLRGATFGIDLLSKAFSWLVDRMERLPYLLMGIKVALAGLALYFFPITAAIVGLLLVLDDLAAYMSGGKSIFGLAMEGIQKVVKAAEPYLDKLTKFGQAFGTVAGIAATAVVPQIPGQNLVTSAVSQSVKVLATQNNQISGGDPAQIAEELNRKHKQQFSDAAMHTNNGEKR